MKPSDLPIQGPEFTNAFLERFYQRKDVTYTTVLGRRRHLCKYCSIGQWCMYKEQHLILGFTSLSEECINKNYGCCDPNKGKKNHIIRIHITYEAVYELPQEDRYFLYQLMLNMINNPLRRYEEFSSIEIPPWRHYCCDSCTPFKYYARYEFRRAHKDTNCVFHNTFKCEQCYQLCPFHREHNCNLCCKDFAVDKRLAPLSPLVYSKRRQEKSKRMTSAIKNELLHSPLLLNDDP